MSEDYFSFMSERGKGNTPEPRSAAVVPAPTAPQASPTSHLPRTNPDSGMEVTETSLSDTMIRQFFRPRRTDKASTALDE